VGSVTVNIPVSLRIDLAIVAQSVISLEPALVDPCPLIATFFNGEVAVVDRTVTCLDFTGSRLTMIGQGLHTIANGKTTRLIQILASHAMLP